MAVRPASTPLTIVDVRRRLIIRKHRARCERAFLVDLLAAMKPILRAYIEGRGEMIYEHHRDVCREIEERIRTLPVRGEGK